jgi:hypothetical protein
MANQRSSTTMSKKYWSYSMGYYGITLKDAYETGRDKGEALGESLIAWPIKDQDIETIDDFVSYGLEAEEGGRDYSPFEFLAYSLNHGNQDPDRAWDEYERGVAVGLRKAWRQYKR